MSGWVTSSCPTCERSVSWRGDSTLSVLVRCPYCRSTYRTEDGAVAATLPEPEDFPLPPDLEPPQQTAIAVLAVGLTVIGVSSILYHLLSVYP